MEQGVGKIEIDKYIDISGNADTNINITEAGFNLKRPDVSYVYVPKEPISPEKFTIDEITAPSDIHLPDIKVNTSSFVQGNGGIGGNGAHSGFFAENYGTYKTKGEDGITLTFRDKDGAHGENTVGNYLDYTDKEIYDNLEIITVDKVNQEGNKHHIGQKVDLEAIKNHNNNRPRHEYIAELNKPGLNVNVASLISTTMDRDSKILGKYNIIYGSGVANYNNSRIFLSVNNAGILWKGDRTGSYNQIGTANNNGDAVDDKNDNEQKKMAVLTEFTGELNLENKIENGKAYGTLIGIDHQLWDTQFDIREQDKDTSTEYLQSYSIAKNSGTINLGDANTDTRHRSLMGISIISERDNVTDRKLHNHVTLNAGTININSENSIGIGFEDGKSLAEDLYVGNVIFNGNKSDSSYGLRLKNSVDHTDNKNQFDGVRVFGSVADNINLGKTQNDEDQNIDDKIKDSDGIKKISIDGHNNGGVVIAKSLSSNATRYLNSKKYLNDPSNHGDDIPKYSGVNIEEYLGTFADDIKIKDENGKEISFGGYDKGKVDPLANVHGLNIEVGGKSNVGFLRHKDYFDNNSNDMVITNTSTSAIKDIDFNNNASGSILIRSDMYGINVEKDLKIEGNGIGEQAKENTVNTQSASNIVLQATKTTWDREKKESTSEGKDTYTTERVNSIGHIQNSGNMTSSMNSLIGMMASTSKSLDKDGKEIEFDKNINGLNGYNGIDDKKQAVIKNTGTIKLDGKNVIGMAVLGDNTGILENGKIDTTMGTDSVSETADKKEYNVSIYNDGNFDVNAKEKNTEIITSGNGSAAVYNTGNTTFTAAADKKNIVKAENGAVALYSKGGSITANGNLEITAEKESIGVYGTDGATINITGGNITAADNSTGIASVGKNTVVSLKDSVLNYSGNRYALFNDEGGKINVDNSTVNLDGKSVGMKVIWGKGNEDIKFSNGSKINVNSNDVVVFNIVSDGTNKMDTSVSKLEEQIGEAIGTDLKDLINVKEGVDLYKTAMVDGGTLRIDENISQSNKNDFYFKRFLGVRLNTTVEGKDGKPIEVRAEISGADADKYFDGKVTGLEIVSSKNAVGLDDTSITLKDGASVIANRLDGEQKEGTATVGVFADFAKVSLENGSSIIVEKKSESEKTEAYKGVGLFAVNGSATTIGQNYIENGDKNAKIEVYGDNAVGIYAKASRIITNEKGETVVLDNEYGEQAGQGRVDITNRGVVDVSNGKGTIGIFANNNKTGASDNSNSIVNNEGLIKTGGSDANNTSVGIHGIKTVINNTGTIEVGNGERDEHGVKHGGVGIYAVNGSEIKSIGKLVLGDYATGVVVDAESKITDKENLVFQGKGNSYTINQSKIGIAYNNIKNDKSEITREHDINITANNVTGLRAVATNGGILNVNKDITLGDNNNRAVIVSGGTANNKGIITISKDNNNQKEDNKVSSVGMVAMDKNATINNENTIELQGNKSIGMYVYNTDEKSENKLGNVGTINISGYGNTGVYVHNSKEDLDITKFYNSEKGNEKEINFNKAEKSTGVHIDGNTKMVVNKTSDSKGKEIATVSEIVEKENILLKATNGAVVENNGIYEVISREEAQNKAVGIALDENSSYTGTGKISVKGGAIGLYAKAGESKTFENLTFNVDSQKMNAIGFALRGQETGKNSKVDLNGTTKITLINTKPLSEGIKENQAAEIEKKAVGMIVTDTDLAINKMEINYGNNILNQKSSGIGIYMKDDVHIVREAGKENKISITGSKSDAYSVGIYVNKNSQKLDQQNKNKDIDIDIDMDIDKITSIGIYNDKNSSEYLKYNGTLNVSAKDAIGIYNNKNTNLEFSGALNITGLNEEKGASVGIYALENSNIKNYGIITTNGAKDAGILGTNSVVDNENKIIVNGGTGVYLTGETSVFNGESNDNGEKVISGITTADDDKSQTAIYIKDGAKLGNGTGDLELGKGDIGVFAENTVVDGRSFNSKINERGNFSVSSNTNVGKDETGAIGIVLENASVKNMNMTLGSNAIGIFGINGKISAENINISSKSKEAVTGILIDKKGKDLEADNRINNANITLTNGYGIVMADSEIGKGTTLTVSNSKFDVQNVSQNGNSAAVVVGSNNNFISLGDGKISTEEFTVNNNIGIYGKENSKINIQNSNIGITGNSVGIYSNGGNVITDNNSLLGIIAGQDADGGAIYVENGEITNGAVVKGLSSNFYGLAVNGKGKVKNTGNIYLGGENNIGISLVDNNGNNSNDSSIDNSGKIAIGNSLGEKRSIGILGRNTDIINKGNLEIIGNTIGVYYSNQSEFKHKLNSIGKISISGKNAIGAFLKGKAEEVFLKDIVDESKNKTGYNMGIYANELATDKLTVENISLQDNSLGMYLKNSNVTANIGKISVKDGEGTLNGKDNSSLAVVVDGGEVNLDITGEGIFAGKDGTAVLNQGGKVTVNDIEKLHVGAGAGSLVHTVGGEVILTDVAEKDKYTLNIDGHYGFILENGGKISGDENFKKKELELNVKNNGTGVIFSQTKEENYKEKPFNDLDINKINIIGTATDDGNYTKGIYYKNLGEINEDLTKLEITQQGVNTAGLVLNGTYGVIKTKDIFLGEKAEHSVAILVKGNGENDTTIIGNLSVNDENIEGAAQKYGNIGLEAQSSNITTEGDIKVGEGFNFVNSYPVGVYLNNIDAKKDKDYLYWGTGALTVGNFATGVSANNYNVLYDGNIKAGVGAVGIIAKNEEYVEGKHYVTALGDITVGDESIADRVKGTGVYAENADITIGLKPSLKDNPIQMNILNNKQNIGVLSHKDGNINFNGNVNISGNTSVDRGENSSVGIYKYGSGIVDINKGKWNVGEKSFGIIANSIIEEKDEDGKIINTTRGEIALTNESDMTIQKGAVGIYSSGNNSITNKGNLAVNGGDEKSTVGIYITNDGSELSTGVNSGTITVDGKNAVGVQAVGNVEFTNETDGVINVLNKGIGMFAADGAKISNKGVINLGDANDKNGIGAIGMYGTGAGTNIINDGTINANNGTGMYVTDGAVLTNNNEININNGIGIKGDGQLINNGHINITSGGVGKPQENDGEISTSVDSIIKITDDVVIIGPNYTGIGGTIDSDFDLKLENPMIDVTAENGLGFNADNISGGITATPDFIQKGNGYSFNVKDFAKDDINLDVNTSPLFDGEITKGDLSINKVDYKDILKDYEYKEFYDALDEALKIGVSEDIDAIKKLNTYLESFGNSPEFYNQYKKTMGESRGSVYSHVQARMQDIERNFNNAFDEMEQSYNLSKDTDKFSVIYTNGDYKNHQTDIPNYEYRIAGLLYMKEFEGTESRDKHGYSYGFTGSRFKFEDTGHSKEDIYSLKGGLHNVKYFDRDLNLLTKLEAGLNYHETDRVLAFGNEKYENDSDFWSYQVSFDNRLRKTLYEDYQNEFGAYIGFETEYGRFTDIKEDGTLALKVKGNDYFSAKASAGLNGTARKYLGNDWTGKITGDVGYSYDFGHNYKENESRLRRTDSGYISLMSEVETKGRAGGKIGIGVERLNHMGVTLEGEAGKDFERDEDYWRIGLRFNYKFNSEDAETTLRNTFNLFRNHFDFDKDKLKRKEQDIIEAGSKIIDKYDLEGTLVLEGHTDSKGSVEYNQGLSERRAETVKRELSSQITKSGNIKYKTKGYSELKPVDTNETSEGRANNRRVEVKYISD